MAAKATKPEQLEKTKKPATKTKKQPAAQEKPAKKKAKKKAPKPPGRPAWEPDLANVETWARLGLKDCEIAALCGVRKETFSTKKTELNEQNEPSELAKALDRGRAKGIVIATTALMKNIAQGDTQAIKFFLERRAGWKQHQVIEKAKSIEEMSDDELALALKKLEEEGL